MVTCDNGQPLDTALFVAVHSLAVAPLQGILRRQPRHLLSECCLP